MQIKHFILIILNYLYGCYFGGEGPILLFNLPGKVWQLLVHLEYIFTEIDAEKKRKKKWQI